MIRFEHVTRRYGAVAAVEDLSLEIAAGEFSVLIGPSGSGKSTAIRMINRLVEHDSGRILFEGREIRSFRPEEIRRRMGYAIQSIGLFPHWTVERNIATVPSLLGWPKARIRARVGELMELFRLDPAIVGRKYPHQLSGGQQQRIGVARALAADPAILLMDEPFGALDPVTRAALQDELLRVHRVSGKTIVLVTHDIDEALKLAGRIVILNQGRVAQAGTPAEILARPASDFVADFIGREEIGIKRLGVETVAARMRKGETAPGAPISAGATLRQALSAFVDRGVERMPVADDEGRILGAIRLADLVRPGAASAVEPQAAPAAGGPDR